MASNSKHVSTGVLERASAFAGGYPTKVAARCADGRIRTVRVGPADTFFSLPANVKLGGKSTRGYVTTRDVDGKTEYVFIAYGDQAPNASDVVPNSLG